MKLTHDIGKGKESDMKKIEKKMIETKAALAEATNALKNQKQKIDKVELEMEEMQNERKSLLEVKLVDIERAIKEADKQVRKLEEGNGGLTEKRAAYEAARAELQKKQVYF